ncbi:MAG TPA: glucoamylase family protein, partial [Pyrinomonadaceae bacterium]
WYDTRSLEPLTPQYVSSVDSGNLAGHLMVIKQTCLDLSDYPLLNKRIVEGLGDTVREMIREVDNLGALKQRTDAVPIRLLREEVNDCARLLLGNPSTVFEWSQFVERLGASAARIQDIVNALAHEHGTESFTEVRFWVGALVHQTESVTRDLETLIPWGDPLKRLLVLEGEELPVELQTAWRKLKTRLDIVPAPSQLTKIGDQALVQLAVFRAEFDQWLAQNSPGPEHASENLDWLRTALESASGAQRSFMARTGSLARLCERFLQEMDFEFLFDEKLKVLTVGYNVSEGQRDNSFYDLLASEARLTSFVAIATGDVPQEHWFRLGRQLTTVQGRRALISWSGTMFEYLMPLLVMRNYRGTLLDETYETVVAAQIAYGRQHGIPWGISESAYNARDLHLTYQYGPFGVPGLGLKRGLGENLVVSPYATILAAMIRPHAALSNLARLEREGARSHLGFYEALDYTPDRVPRNQRYVIVRAFMTHHQGMSMVALDNLLNDRIMQRRFHSEPQVQADELLLQERIPRAVPTVKPRAAEVAPRLTDETAAVSSARRYATADLAWPGTQLLSNGTYTVMFTTAGGGYSNYRGIGVTRWREDTTRDHWGSFCYLRDVRSGAVWSATYQPTTRTPQAYDVLFAEDKVDVWREDVGIITHTELIVSTEDNAEVRRVSLTNQSSRDREIELTTYAEVTLADPANDAAHPAISNLFIETEFFQEENALLARRRPRLKSSEELWGLHTIAVEGTSIGAVQVETDRSRFLGRGRSPAEPAAVMEDQPLSNTVGPVLDPIFSLRQRVVLQPGETARFTLATGVANTREEALRLADKYHDVNVFEREARFAWTRAQVEMRHLGIDAEEAHLFQELGSRVLYSNPALRPRPHVLRLNRLTQSALWQYGISGDLPIILVRINDARDLRIVRQVLRGHEYLRLKGLITDLVILNDHPASYLQELQTELETLARKSGSHHLLDKPGGIFLRRTDIMPEADRILLHTVARVVLVTERGSLSDQLLRLEPEGELPPEFIPRWPPKLEPSSRTQLPELLFFNGLGGFSQNGREYVTVLGQGQWTPAPWSNVVANPSDFGFVVSENGSGFTWSVNSRDNRLTPWTNDVVSDPPGEIVYLRDEDTGATWSPTPLPIRETTAYTIRHGQGYSVFEHSSNGISQELLMFVPLDSPVKIMKLRLRNRSGRKRRLSLTAYLELVLGTQRANSAPFVMTEVDPETGAIFASNPYNNEFAGRITFAATGETNYTATCDRREFLGRNGSPARPAALRRTSLSGRIGAGLDPCIAIQSLFELAPEEVREILVLVGQSANIEQAREIVSSYRQPSVVNAAFEQVVAYWDELLGSVEISTPDPAMDLIVNRWLLYQTLSCRLWARSAFYQSSGAYGFRDQLQDVTAISYSKPKVAREHILRAATRQFKEGDVQH